MVRNPGTFLKCPFPVDSETADTFTSQFFHCWMGKVENSSCLGYIT